MKTIEQQTFIQRLLTKDVWFKICLSTVVSGLILSVIPTQEQQDINQYLTAKKECRQVTKQNDYIICLQSKGIALQEPTS